jgi:uncharacterized protein YodC (DUF2158 family)
MQRFTIGDFVRLRIGGEVMLIVAPDALKPHHWICSWVDQEGQVQTSSIDFHLLRYVGPSYPSPNKSVSPDQ